MDGRTRSGQFAKGNRAALKHGLYSVQAQAGTLDEQRDMRALIEARRAAILADLGGADTVGTIKSDLVDRYLELDTLATWLAQNLMASGLLTPRGRTRATYQAYLLAVDRQQRVGALLGLDRQAKPAVPHPLDYIRELAPTGKETA